MGEVCGFVRVGGGGLSMYRWAGGKYGREMRHAVGSYAEDNSGTVKSVDDDQGLPESPIYSNFSKHLWTTHTRKGRVQSENRARATADGLLQPPVKPLTAVTGTGGKGATGIGA